VPVGEKSLLKGAGLRRPACGSRIGAGMLVHTCLREYKLKDPVLQRIARIVDGSTWFRK
jgi:hypothetical protein